MASRFVSGGTNEEPTERDEAWLKAQQEIESKRQQKLETDNQPSGQSLYETLQANKAAKQEAFEESTRLKNQFRSLDDDEVEFLDSVLESTRAKEAEVQKENREQLQAFKIAQQEAEKLASLEDDTKAPVPTDAWTAGPRKRKKGTESVVGGVKLRRTSTAEKQSTDAVVEAESESAQEMPSAKVQETRKDSEPVNKKTNPVAMPKANTSLKASGLALTAPKSPSPSTGLGLAAYSSDEED